MPASTENSFEVGGYDFNTRSVRAGCASYSQTHAAQQVQVQVGRGVASTWVGDLMVTKDKRGNGNESVCKRADTIIDHG